MWLKIYILAIVAIVVLTILWYRKELRREKSKISEVKNSSIDRREPLLNMAGSEEKTTTSVQKIAIPLTTTSSTVSSTAPVASSTDTIKMEIRAYPDQPYMGYELLQSLLAADLRYGEMNVFNRYASDGKQVLFNLAVASPNHSFELSTMGGFSCSGLVISMPLTGRGSRGTFDLMLDTASQLIDDLGGELLDEQQLPVGDESIKQWREKIRVFEERQSSS